VSGLVEMIAQSSAVVSCIRLNVSCRAITNLSSSYDSYSERVATRVRQILLLCFPCSLSEVCHMSVDEHDGAYRSFGGIVDRAMSRSTPWWPERPTPPRDSPHVVVILVDDLGFSDLGCFGSEIATPHIDSLATDGVKFNNFHAQPSCSPTRASLLTGLECHTAGFGFPAQFDPGFPGYAMELPGDVVTAGEIFRANGYSTLMSGKWHLSREADGAASGSRHSWPIQRGFDRFYGFLDGFTDYFHPHQLIVDNTAVCIDEYPDGYYLTDDLTDRAIDMVRDVHAADPSKPFFLYLAHGAVHAPLQAKPDDIAKYVDRYHVGWDEIRAERFERQRALGVVGRDTELPARNSEPGNQVAAWADLSDDERRLYARYMAVYAAMVDNLDQNVGRLLAALDDLGVRDNTVVVLLSDNGASREGGERGTTTYLEGLHGAATPDVAADLARLDLIGSSRVHAHYPRGWAMASNTPNRLYKITTHAGGHQVPMVISWPRRLTTRGSRDQYAHVVDILPTLIDMIGLSPLARRNGADARPMVGASFGLCSTNRLHRRCTARNTTNRSAVAVTTATAGRSWRSTTSALASRAASGSCTTSMMTRQRPPILLTNTRIWLRNSRKSSTTRPGLRRSIRSSTSSSSSSACVHRLMTR
jgi:arylsulfatase A-like enzyme